MLKEYYRLTKPGIIYGNAINAAAGFAFASVLAWVFDLWLLVAVLAGTALIIGSGCVFNNYIDRGIDKHMARTKKRALVNGRISGRNALVYASLLGVAGFTILALWTNWLTVLIGAIGYVDYIVLYGYFKRKSVHGTLVGAISGATPPVAGNCAVTGQFDSAAFLLFLILMAWQMPHFYAIAMYRSKDYAAAGIPVLPVVKGNQQAKIQILVYVALFTLATILLSTFGYTGLIYMGVMVVLGAYWLQLAVAGFKAPDDNKWARKMFFFSLIVTLAVAVMLPLGALLP
jgi:heme o synthase